MTSEHDGQHGPVQRLRWLNLTTLVLLFLARIDTREAVDANAAAVCDPASGQAQTCSEVEPDMPPIRAQLRGASLRPRVLVKTGGSGNFGEQVRE